ncbi:MAG TPA: tetratricopeptide repeat protein [Pyrinomonadaceae bacterium]|jgi:tetratricopeptide (TPR) repeat protein|nr:tetratricopeptide repeat protein [Pyrinomonadaceae bacterium]
MRISFSRFLAVSLAGALGALTVHGQGATRTPTAAQPTANNSSIVVQAQSLLDAGQIDSAIEMLSVAARFKPDDPEVRHLLGLAFYRKNDYQRAIEHISAVVRLSPENSRRYREQVQILGLSHYLLGHIREALPYLEQLNQWSPASTEIAYALGISYIQTRNPDKSRETFARIFNVAPASASAYLVNAQMMVRQQFEELAVKELEKALELDPRLPQANFLLGEMAIYHSDIDRGIELLQKEIALNPAFGMAHYRLGEAYTRQLKWDEAIGPLQKSIWLNPFFSGPYIVLGKVYLKKNDLPNAGNMLRRAVQMDPNNFSGHHLLAQVLQQANRAEEAKKEFELAEKLRTGADKEP